MPQSLLTKQRRLFHNDLLCSILSIDGDIPTNADSHNKASIRIATGILKRIGPEALGSRAAAQTAGRKFEAICADFLKATFPQFSHLRPGKWSIDTVSSSGRLLIAKYAQYEHLIALESAAKHNPALAAALGTDYTITPDIIVVRDTEDDDSINSQERLVDDLTALHAALRRKTDNRPLLHASISCKWTIRSDRAQNSRSEALNLIRNRKGRLPHIAVVTGEPTPARIASIALGTGDIDCVYHFALQELLETVEELEMEDASELLKIMVNGRRLKDISDLPLDLAV